MCYSCRQMLNLLHFINVSLIKMAKIIILSRERVPSILIGGAVNQKGLKKLGLLGLLGRNICWKETL
jgi:hypothetical protein